MHIPHCRPCIICVHLTQLAEGSFDWGGDCHPTDEWNFPATNSCQYIRWSAGLFLKAVRKNRGWSQLPRQIPKRKVNLLAARYVRSRFSLALLMFQPIKIVRLKRVFSHLHVNPPFNASFVCSPSWHRGNKNYGEIPGIRRRRVQMNVYLMISLLRIQIRSANRCRNDGNRLRKSLNSWGMVGNWLWYPRHFEDRLSIIHGLDGRCRPEGRMQRRELLRK